MRGGVNLSAASDSEVLRQVSSLLSNLRGVVMSPMGLSSSSESVTLTLTGLMGGVGSKGTPIEGGGDPGLSLKAELEDAVRFRRGRPWDPMREGSSSHPFSSGASARVSWRFSYCASTASRSGSSSATRSEVEGVRETGGEAPPPPSVPAGLVVILHTLGQTSLVPSLSYPRLPSLVFLSSLCLVNFSPSLFSSRLYSHFHQYSFVLSLH